jgi:hypothetical protein
MVESCKKSPNESSAVKSDKQQNENACLDVDASPISNSGFSDYEDFDDDSKAAIGEDEESKSALVNVIDSKRLQASGEQEERGETFSDWSDDDDDSILQCELESAPKVIVSDRLESKDEDSRHSIADTARSGSFNGGPPQREVFDPVSDDDLDEMMGDSYPLLEDSQHSVSRKQMLDNLEIDWASLVTQPKILTEQVSHSARERCSAANMLANAGISKRYAGSKLTLEVENFVKKELGSKFEGFKHPVANIHCYLTEKTHERRKLFEDVDGLFSSALSARKDQRIRKLFGGSTLKKLLKEPTVSALEALEAGDVKTVSVDAS